MKELKKCPICGEKLITRTFCKNCCIKTCPNCGRRVNKWNVWCQGCGYELPVRGLIHNIQLISRFDFSYPQAKLIKKYWNKKCTDLTRNLFDLYGITTFGLLTHRKGQSIFEQCLTKRQFKEFLKKYEGLEYISHWKNALDGYAEAILYKEGKIQKSLKEFSLRKCLNCGKKFTPLTIDARVVRAFIPKESFSEINFCGQCLAKAFYGIMFHQVKFQRRTKKKMIKDLQDFVNTLGFIPPRDYINNKKFRESVKEKFGELIPILVRIETPKLYRKRFGSWLKALIEADILKGKIRITPRGIMCVSKDGHDCLSLSERNIDDWLYNNKINHKKEPKYPMDKQLNPNGLLRADWKIGNIFVEFFGLTGSLNYDNKSEIKRKLCKKNNIQLIEIFNRDLYNLDKKLNFLKFEK